MIPQIRNCSQQDFTEVKRYIHDYQLDDRDLNIDQFLVMRNSTELLGFGRMREYDAFCELCTLGILERERSKGFGKRILKALMEKTEKPLFLVCIIPEYFEDLGFKICFDYPAEITDKLNYCTQGLAVEEPYVVMSKMK